MTTCFIFVHKLDEEQCLCLRLDRNGHVDAPLALRSISDVKALQNNARTIIVLPTESSSLHEVELPWLGERKARAAIPFALEEQLAQNVTTLHFAFDRKYYQNSRYLVAITDKQFLVGLIAKLDALQLHFDLMTLDWFALKENEVCVTENGLLIHDHLFKGALSGELAAIYLSSPEKQAQFWMFKDSLSSLKNDHCTSVDSTMFVWIAERLLQANAINLCQGELQHGSRQHDNKYWYQAAAVLAGVMLISVFVFKGLYLHTLNAGNADLDKKIAVIYREFFPGAKQIISPKFRIGQLLKGEGANSDASSLWILLDKFAEAFNNDQFMVDQFRFQNRVLSVTLISNNFSALEALQQRLQQAKVKVTQSQASSHEKKVMATLELSL